MQSPPTQGSRLVPVAIVVIALASLGAGWIAWSNAEQARIAREDDEREARQQAERLARQREESMALMPPPLRGVALGMDLEEVRAVGHNLERSTSRPPAGMHLDMYEERLENGAQMMFGFSDSTGHLQQVQVMSMLPRLDAIALHLSAMNEQYGTPSGVWDCPDTQGLPTRRFTWRHSQTAISDVFLVYNDRASLTLYIATVDTIARSLRMGQCTPVPRERLDQFPTASPEQIREATEQGG